MRRIGFLFPPVVLLPISLGFAMVWLFLSMYGWLGFADCQPWDRIPQLPASPLHFVDTFGKRVFLQAADGRTYCYVQNQWTTCLPSPYPAKLDAAPSWLMTRFVHVSGQNLQQVVRENFFLDATYYALSDTGAVWTCSATFESFMSSIWRSGTLTLLLLPLAIGCWCLISFWQIFIRHAQPVLWDWFGHGTPIK